LEISASVGFTAATTPRTNHNDIFQLIILITITLASSNNTLPNDGD
jgi:hypothetical protein